MTLQEARYYCLCTIGRSRPHNEVLQHLNLRSTGDCAARKSGEIRVTLPNSRMIAGMRASRRKYFILDHGKSFPTLAEP